MKKLKPISTLDNFGQFILATEEMISVRGGEDTPGDKVLPPVHV